MMTTSLEEVPGSFVVVFFSTKAGDLRCRVTDVVTREAWIVDNASALWQLLVKRHATYETDVGGSGP